MPRLLISPRRFLKIGPDEVLFQRRGFQCSQKAIQERLETSAGSFVTGYHFALEQSQPQALAERLDDVPLAFRGFAYEGAGMALTLQDHLAVLNRTNSFREFLLGPGNAHAYMLHVGAGWALARLPWLRSRVETEISKLDPLLRWLALDGFGFHEGYFHPKTTVDECIVPRSVRHGYLRRAFDQGLGRSLWFVKGADPQGIAQTIQRFEIGRQGDLWSGVGLACGYAGGLSSEELGALTTYVHPFLPDFAQGLAFAAKTRLRAGNPVPHTELACRIVCGISASEAAAMTDRALIGLEFGGSEPAYECWRSRIQYEFVGTWSKAGASSSKQSSPS